MANRKKKDEALAAVQAQTEGSGQPAVQSGYSAAGLDSRSEVENALANSSYKPSQTVTDAANALKEWQANRPGDYQSSYQERIDQLLNQLLQRESFQYSYTKDPLYRQYEQNYLQNAHNASADAAAQAAALTGGYGSSYATSAAQQAYQQQIGALSSAIPTLYSLALDTYTSGGNELVSQLDQLNNSEQDAQQQYNNKLSDYYTQLQQKGEAYNNAYAQDYSAYQDYLSQLGTLHDYYSAQEQQQAARRQQVFSNVMTVLGVLGDAVQIVLSGTTGVGSMLSGLLNTGYNIYSGNRAYEAERADTQWNQQMQEKQRQDSLTQQRYENEASERAYQDALKQQAFNNSVTSEKLNIAKGEWALKQSNAQAKASRAAGNAAAKSRGSGKASGSAAGTNALKGSSVVPFTAALLRSRGATVFEENIFENRYRHVDELIRMGASIRVSGRVAVVTGVERLHSAPVRCTDLRGGAALCVAALAAEGETRVSQICHIDRGYEDLARDLRALGADAVRVEETENG